MIGNYANESVVKDQAMITKARTFELANNKENLIKLIFGAKKIMGKKDVSEAFDLAEENQKIDGAPTTGWGFAQGVTRLARTKKYADERTEMDFAVRQRKRREEVSGVQEHTIAAGLLSSSPPSTSEPTQILTGILHPSLHSPSL